MNAMEEKCSPSSGTHHPSTPMQQSSTLDLSANSFGLQQKLLQQQQLQCIFMHQRDYHQNSAVAPDAIRRSGIPPLSPYSQMPPPRSPSSSSSSSPFRARSSSQTAFFSLDSLPPLSLPQPTQPPPLAPISMQLLPTEAATSWLQPVSRTLAGLSSFESSSSNGRFLPRKAHRRSQSDIPWGISGAEVAGFPFQPSFLTPAMITGPAAALPLPQRLRQQQLVKQESSEWEKESQSRHDDGGDGGDDLISAYMNLDNIETLNSVETEERREYVNGRRLSEARTNGTADSSENETESSSVNESSGGGDRKEGYKRNAAGDLVCMNSKHHRSLSIDSSMSKLFGDESRRFPPSEGNLTGQLSRSGSMDGTTANMLNLELGNGEFNSAELKKIAGNEKLAEMALTDPKRVKRILANRQSAARSKERKMRYISELEHKVQTLQTEATTLSAQLTLLQRDLAGLTSRNNELKFRIQSVEQQAQLRDALNQALTAEVHRLKLATGEITEPQLSKNMNQQMNTNAQGFQLNQLQPQQQQSLQAPRYQLLMPEQQQQNNARPTVEEKVNKPI